MDHRNRAEIAAVAEASSRALRQAMDLTGAAPSLSPSPSLWSSLAPGENEGGISVEALIDAIGEVVVLVDADYRVLYCSRAYPEMLGLPMSRVLGQRAPDFIDDFERSSFYQTFERCRLTKQPVQQPGFSTAMQAHMFMRLYPTPGGGLLMFANYATQAMLRGYEQAIQGRIDDLTRLATRHALVGDLRELISADKPCSLLTLSISNHDVISDKHGSEFADLMLLAVIARLRTRLGVGEPLYRLDTAQFALVVEGGFEAAEHVARLRGFIDAIGLSVDVDNVTVALCAHGSVARYPHDASSCQALLHSARLALREARTAPHAHVEPYRAQHNRRLQLEREIHHALKSEQFELFAQPKQDLFSGRLSGAEMLIRWRHPRRGLVPPADFLHVAAQMQLMPALDRFVLARALDDQLELRRRGVRVPVSINISAGTLGDPSFPALVRDELAKRSLEPHMLEIEVPEGAVMHDVRASIEVLKQLRQIGVPVSIDDFGTGYSSLAYLAILPVTTLKIDRSFVGAMLPGSTNASIVDMCIKLAHSASMRVVAEGVETDEQLQMLRERGCDAIQGYHYARPMPLDEFATFARDEIARYRPPFGCAFS